MNKPRLGILAGMGAAAGAYLYSFLIKECQRRGAKRDEDFPEVVLLNSPNLGIDAQGRPEHETVPPLIMEHLRFFDMADCARVLIACNSVHVWHPYFQSDARADIVNMPAAAMAEYEASRKFSFAPSFGVITSAFTRQSELYPCAMRTTEKEQGYVDTVISQAIRGYAGAGITFCGHQDTIRGIIRRMKHSGAEKVILGCTELRLVFPPELDEGDVIDAGEAGVRALLDGVI